MLPTDYITRINSKKYVHKDSSNEKKSLFREKTKSSFPNSHQSFEISGKHTMSHASQIEPV